MDTVYIKIKSVLKIAINHNNSKIWKIKIDFPQCNCETPKTLKIL